LDRSSQLALRVNRNPGGAFMRARDQSARVPLRVSPASRSYAKRFGASKDSRKRAPGMFLNEPLEYESRRDMGRGKGRRRYE
jgi:hypothetical protein